MSHLVPFFFFNDTATTEIYTLSLHDALPIFDTSDAVFVVAPAFIVGVMKRPYRVVVWRADGSLLQADVSPAVSWRSEEHTSELQSQSNLVCRLLLEKKKTTTYSLLLSSSTRV